MVFLSYTQRRIANAEREGIQLSWSHWKCVMTLKRRNMGERGAETVEFAIVARLLITLLSDIVTNRVILPAPSTVTQEEAGAPKPAHDRERPDRDDCLDGTVKADLQLTVPIETGCWTSRSPPRAAPQRSGPSAARTMP